MGLAKFTGIGKGAPVEGSDAKDLDGLSQGIDFHELVLHAFPKNIFAAFGEGNLLGAIVFALLVGVAMAAIGEKSEPFAAVLESVASVMFKVVGYVIRIAPLGVLGFISYDVAHYGFGNLRSLMGFIAVVYAGLAIVVGVLFPLIAAIYRVRYVHLLKSIAGLAGIAFVTRSSESVLAPLMGKLEAFGLSRSTTSFVVPLGYSFNTDGSVLYQAAALVFLANAYGADTSLPALLLMVGVLVILSKGMAGVASASIVVLLAMRQLHRPARRRRRTAPRRGLHRRHGPHRRERHRQLPRSRRRRQLREPARSQTRHRRGRPYPGPARGRGPAEGTRPVTAPTSAPAHTPARATEIIGILGGMGPAATADFYAKLVSMTPGSSDQDHLRAVIWSDPTIPDRTEALLGDGPDPTPWLLDGSRVLRE